MMVFRPGRLKEDRLALNQETRERYPLGSPLALGSSAANASQVLSEAWRIRNAPEPEHSRCEAPDGAVGEEEAAAFATRKPGCEARQLHQRHESTRNGAGKGRNNRHSCQKHAAPLQRAMKRRHLCAHSQWHHASSGLMYLWGVRLPARTVVFQAAGAGAAPVRPSIRRGSLMHRAQSFGL